MTAAAYFAANVAPILDTACARCPATDFPDACDDPCHEKYPFDSQQPKIDAWFQQMMASCLAVHTTETCLP